MQPLLPPREEIHKLLAFVSANQASDLHLKVDYPPTVRIGGHLRRVDSPLIPNSEYIEADDGRVDASGEAETVRRTWWR